MKGTLEGQFSYTTQKTNTSHEITAVYPQLRINRSLGFIGMTGMFANYFSEIGICSNSITHNLFPKRMTAGSSNEARKYEISSPMLYRASESKKRANSTTSQMLWTGRPGNESYMVARILFLTSPGGVFLNGQVTYPNQRYTSTKKP
ncbi:MAG: hypothetical protein M1834_004936 [Cirrosporium novae-zelandiae]|nr:MAG: hypothetical protein M1834_004936 [Cirrosporium novae-zelandiae]